MNKQQRRNKKNRAEQPQNSSFLHSKSARYFFLIAVLIGAFVLRYSDIRIIKLGLLTSDDPWWHWRVVQDIERFGYRPSTITWSWVPYERAQTYPPFFHYLIYGLTRAFNADSYQIMANIGPYLGLLSVLGLFLFFRELYNSWATGLIGAGIYSVSGMLVLEEIAGASRPEIFAAAVFPFVLYYLARAQKKQRVRYALVAGALLAIQVLTWEASLLMHLGFIVIFWLFSTISGQVKKQSYYVLALMIAAVAAFSWYGPIYASYGLPWTNAPSVLMARTTILNSSDFIPTLETFLARDPIFGLLAIVGAPLLFLLTKKKKLPQETFGLLIFTLGFVTMFSGFGGSRIWRATLPFGAVLVATSLLSISWSHVKTEKTKKKFLTVLLILFLAHWFYTNYYVSIYVNVFYYQNGLYSLRELIGHEVPRASVIVCWLTDCSFLLGNGERTLYDLYLEHLPAYADEQVRKALSIFLKTNETESILSMQEFGADYILVNREMTYPESMEVLLEASGRTGEKPSAYFRWFSPYSPFYWPTELGSKTLLARLLWNMTHFVNPSGLPVPPSPEHFTLVWKNYQLSVALFKVIEQRARYSISDSGIFNPSIII